MCCYSNQSKLHLTYAAETSKLNSRKKKLIIRGCLICFMNQLVPSVKWVEHCHNYAKYTNTNNSVKLNHPIRKHGHLTAKQALDSKCLSIDPSLKKQEHKFLQLGIFILKNKTKKSKSCGSFQSNIWPQPLAHRNKSMRLLKSALSLTCSSLSAYQFLIIIIIISNLIWPISHN